MYIILKSDVNLEMIGGIVQMYLYGKVRSGASKGRLTPWDVRRIETFQPVLDGRDAQMREELVSVAAVWVMENIHRLERDIDWNIIFKGDSYFSYAKALDKFVGLQANDQYQRHDVIRKRDDGTKYRTTVYTPRALYFDAGDESTLMELDSTALRRYLIDQTDSLEEGSDGRALLMEYCKRYMISHPNQKDRTKMQAFWWVIVQGEDLEKVAQDMGKSQSTIYRWIADVREVVCEYIHVDSKIRAMDKSTGIIRESREDGIRQFSRESHIKGRVLVRDGKATPQTIVGRYEDESVKEVMTVVGSTVKSGGDSTTIEEINGKRYFDFSVYDSFLKFDTPELLRGECYQTGKRKSVKATSEGYIPRDKRKRNKIYSYYRPELKGVREGYLTGGKFDWNIYVGWLPIFDVEEQTN